MRKGLFVILACLLMVSFHFAYAADVKGNGKLVTRKIDVSNFDKIEFGPSLNYSGSMKNLFNNGSKGELVMYYTQKSGASELEITTDENIFSLLKVGVSDGKLTIQVEKGNKISPTKFVVKASSSALAYLKATGSVDVVINSALKGDKLNCEISGASDVLLKGKVNYSDIKLQVSGSGDFVTHDLNCNRIEVMVSGSGDIDLKGKADTGNFRASGSGDIKGFGFIVNTLDARASGSGDIKAHAKESLSAAASGSGDIQYKGNPKVDSKVSGSGTIRKAN